jgi:uncharacterized protein YkwD
MPTSRRRTRRDGSVARYRGGPEPVLRSRPASPPDDDPGYDPGYDEPDDFYEDDSEPPSPRSGPQPAWLASVVGSDAHRARIEDAVTTLTNAVRADAGAPPLRTDERLRRAARSHSTDMATRNFVAHVDPDGVAPADRMHRHGHPQPGGENVAVGQAGATEVVQAWLNSPGHRANLLNPDFTSIGVGVHLDRHRDGPGPWWTQNFGYGPAAS